MPVLKNPKHERFAQELAKGKGAVEAASLAGASFCGDQGDDYVYALVDPIADEVFYIGKGRGRRYSVHLSERRAGRIVNPDKYRRIGQIVESGNVPLAFCLADSLTEREAFCIERRMIAAIGLERLTNAGAGQFTAIDRAVILAGESLRRIKPYCVWFEENEERQKLDRHYWGIIGEFSEIIALGNQTKSNGAIHASRR